MNFLSKGNRKSYKKFSIVLKNWYQNIPTKPKYSQTICIIPKNHDKTVAVLRTKTFLAFKFTFITFVLSSLKLSIHYKNQPFWREPSDTARKLCISYPYWILYEQFWHEPIHFNLKQHTNKQTCIVVPQRVNK